MKNPYVELGVDPRATDDEIRKAWLEMVHRYPPETAPEKFREIREAYEKISTRTQRLRYYLFSTEWYIDSPIEALTGQLEHPGNRRPPLRFDLQKMIERLFDKVYLQKEVQPKK